MRTVVSGLCRHVTSFGMPRRSSKALGVYKVGALPIPSGEPTSVGAHFSRKQLHVCPKSIPSANFASAFNALSTVPMGSRLVSRRVFIFCPPAVVVSHRRSLTVVVLWMTRELPAALPSTPPAPPPSTAGPTSSGTGSTRPTPTATSPPTRTAGPSPTPAP